MSRDEKLYVTNEVLVQGKYPGFVVGFERVGDVQFVHVKIYGGRRILVPRGEVERMRTLDVKHVH